VVCDRNAYCKNEFRESIMSLEYRGSRPPEDASDPNLGLLVLSTSDCQATMDSFPVTRAKTLNLLQGGWSDAVSTSFSGANNLLTQASLSSLLAGSNNPCLRSSDVSAVVSNFLLNSSIGAKGGVASIDSTGKIPLSQLPSMGDGFIIGPFGYVYSSTAQQVNANGPVASGGAQKLTEWAIGSPGGKNFQVMVFMQVNAATSTNLGRTVIEVRMSNGPATTYNTLNPLVATGTGRTFYTGYQPVTVLPCGSAQGQVSSYYPASNWSNLYLTAWVYDAGRQYISTTTINSTDIVLGTAFLIQSTAS